MSRPTRKERITTARWRAGYPFGHEFVWDAQNSCELDCGLREVRWWLEYTAPTPVVDFDLKIEATHLAFINVWLDSTYGDDAPYSLLNTGS